MPKIIFTKKKPLIAQPFRIHYVFDLSVLKTLTFLRFFFSFLFDAIRSKLREWVLTKVVNGERASYSAPKFARMQERTRSQMLEDIVANLANHAETGQIPKPYRRGSWRPIGEDPCMLRVTVSCCMRLYVPHSMYLKTLSSFSMYL